MFTIQKSNTLFTIEKLDTTGNKVITPKVKYTLLYDVMNTCQVQQPFSHLLTIYTHPSLSQQSDTNVA